MPSTADLLSIPRGYAIPGINPRWNPAYAMRVSASLKAVASVIWPTCAYKPGTGVWRQPASGYMGPHISSRWWFSVKKSRLLSWDGEPYDVPDWRTVTVHPDHHISYRYALYSVPSTSCPPGTRLEVAATVSW